MGFEHFKEESCTAEGFFLVSFVVGGYCLLVLLFVCSIVCLFLIEVIRVIFALSVRLIVVTPHSFQ